VVYRVQSLASGQVSLIFHVNAESADTALAFVHLRGKTVELSLTIP
jgi:hypothetical protein